jgi:hypothetical protein
MFVSSLEAQACANKLTGSRNKTTLASSDQSARDIEASLVRHKSLGPGHQRPHHHEQRKNLLKAISLDKKLDRELRSQETQELDSCAVVIIVLIHVQVVQELIGQGVRHISAVELEA